MKNMRKIIIGMILLVSSMTLFAERVSQEDAALVANEFMNNATQTVNGVRKAAPHRRMVMKQAASQNENQYYVFENANGEGWIIVSAEDAVTPVLAYSQTGHFRTDNMPVNVRKWMSKYDTYIKRIVKDGVIANEQTQEEWNALRAGMRKAGTPVVGPLVQTQWDQDAPYNNQCPGSGSNKAYTGCVATAMAQVMKYWEWPKKGTGSHSYKPLDPNSEEGQYSTRYTKTLSANFGNTTYDWNNMLDTYYSSATSAQKTAVATLMYHCGVATEMMYGNDADGGSGTFTGNYGDLTWGVTTTDEGGCAENALWAYFGYKKEGLISYMRDGYESEGEVYYQSWTDEDWTAMVKAELDKQHPILYGGASDAGGHSFICDGYDNANYFHFNWGWSGDNDGFYRLSNLNPGGGGAGGGDYDFSYDQDVIIGIEPDSTGYVPSSDTIVPVDPDTIEPIISGDDFVLLTNISSLETGDEVIFVSTAHSVAAGEESSNNNAAWLTPEEVEISGTQIALTSGSAVKIMTVGKSGNNWTFTNNGQLLVVTAAKKVKFATSGTSTWTIDIASNGNATIQSTTESYGRFLYNVNTPRFTTYTSQTSSSMVLPQIYVRKPESASGIENTNAETKTIKQLENGQIVIVRGGEKFSILGQKIQ